MQWLTPNASALTSAGSRPSARAMRRTPPWKPWQRPTVLIGERRVISVQPSKTGLADCTYQASGQTSSMSRITLRKSSNWCWPPR